MGLLGFFLATAACLAVFCSSEAVPLLQTIAATPPIPVPQVPVTYAFGYDTSDGLGMTQHRHETLGTNGIVEGTYGYLDPLGVYRRVAYTADASGFRARIRSNEPGMDNRNPADSVFVVEPAPPAAISQGTRIVFPIKNAL